MNSLPAQKIAHLTQADVAAGLQVLRQRDPDFDRLLKQIGAPPMWAREPGFATLVHIILEQQVSLASAKAAFDRLLAVVTPLTPLRFFELDDTALRTIGFSRQKAGYCRDLAQSLTTGQLDLDALETRDDAAVRAALTAIRGIGPWTADVYLLMVLRRPDIWPNKDLALAVAVQEVKGLAARPGPEELESFSLAWKPWRAVAARLLWHYYLTQRRLKHPILDTPPP